MFNCEGTVFALSSGHGKCGVAVIRASGPQALEAMLRLGRFTSPPEPRYAVFRKLTHPDTAETIDHGLVLWFPAPFSFTGEDSVEFQVHGGPAVVLSLLAALATIPGCRHAEPGDFTKRAFFNGKLELTAVEGLGDLIHAETEAQRKQALRQMEGDLGRLYHKWREELVKNVSHVEAEIDFGEDENIEKGVFSKVREAVGRLSKEIASHLDDGRRGETLRSGVHVTIVGAPNAGKSSLLNILCQRPTAIVSPYAGTTRDVLESTLDVFGFPVVLSDTAGLRKTANPIEQEGVQRALKKAESADLKILIADCSLLTELIAGQTKLALPQLARLLLQDSTADHGDGWLEGAANVLTPEDTIVVFNKTDLLATDLPRVSPVLGGREGASSSSSSVCWLSCRTEEGMDGFMQTLKRHLEGLCGNPLSGDPSITQARHRQNLELCQQHLQSFLEYAGSSHEWVLDVAAEELRLAIAEVGRITGRVGVEEILDVVFQDFCIGK